MSRMDLSKLVEPVLRPAKIPTRLFAQWFSTPDMAASIRAR